VIQLQNKQAIVIGILLAAFAVAGSLWELVPWLHLRHIIYGSFFLDRFRLRDALLIGIPLIPLLVTGYIELYSSKPAYGIASDDLAALTWGFRAQTAVQAFFALIDRLALARDLLAHR
jgi:hypothetical protein